jgi:hypothetical protein
LLVVAGVIAALAVIGSAVAIRELKLRVPVPAQSSSERFNPTGRRENGSLGAAGATAAALKIAEHAS